MAEGQVRVLVLSGPNLNLLGEREPDVYGTDTLEAIHERLRRRAAALGAEAECRQHNGEGELIDALHAARGRTAGVVFNPGAYAHTSYALRDAVAAVSLPVVEVHLSNVYAREPFRRRSVIAPACRGTIVGLGAMGYELALEAVVRLARESGGG
ncbi:MAG: type II 3-dehydroquinate dehydratase [Firmicutes bacterium]|nr:type II 3-dehydroquinate dehydratase [Bacillota bacterium]